MVEEVKQVEEQLSPFEQAKALRDDMARILEETKKERSLLERTLQDLVIAGKSYAGSKPVEKTQDDIAAEAADKFIKRFRK